MRSPALSLDSAFAWALVPLGGVAIYEGLRVGLVTDRILGPGFFPFCIGLLLLAGAILLIFESRRESSKQEPARPVDNEQDESSGKRSLVLHAAMMAALVIMLVPLGLTTTIAIYTFVTLRFVSQRSWLQSLAITIGVLVVVWVGLGQLLGVSLARGMFGF